MSSNGVQLCDVRVLVLHSDAYPQPVAKSHMQSYCRNKSMFSHSMKIFASLEDATGVLLDLKAGLGAPGTQLLRKLEK